MLLVDFKKSRFARFFDVKQEKIEDLTHLKIKDNDTLEKILVDSSVSFNKNRFTFRKLMFGF